MRDIWIRREMNEQGINKLKELRLEVQAQKREGGENSEQVKKLTLRVVDMQVRIMVTKRCHGKSSEGTLRVMYRN